MVHPSAATRKWGAFFARERAWRSSEGLTMERHRHREDPAMTQEHHQSINGTP
jgi:hypothetical protein